VFGLVCGVGGGLWCSARRVLVNMHVTKREGGIVISDKIFIAMLSLSLFMNEIARNSTQFDRLENGRIPSNSACGLCW
jgi:hypothetical protein